MMTSKRLEEFRAKMIKHDVGPTSQAVVVLTAAELCELLDEIERLSTDGVLGPDSIY